MIVPNLIVITPSISRIDGSIYGKYSANYGVFCPLMNLTKFNYHVNIAYISAYAAPDLYRSSVYVACTHTKNNRRTDVGVEH